MTAENQTLWNEHLAIERQLEVCVSQTGRFPDDVATLLARQRRIWDSIIVNPGQEQGAIPPPADRT